MVDVLITYETLYEILRREKSRDEIQNLDDNFHQDVLKYLNDKKAILDSQKSKDNIFSSQEVEKTKKQLENIYRILKELYEKRESKIVNLALVSSRVNGKTNINDLLKEEMNFYEGVRNVLNSFRESILGNLLKGEKPSVNEPKVIKSNIQDKVLIRFINAVPKFKGENGFIYGPFEEHDVANLPLNIGNLLIENNRAEKI